MPAYYNEIDGYAAQWLRNLIAAALIAPGDVDERSIVDIRASDLAGYEQCHFFAGIGGWSCALRLAGWSDTREVWTGSCPCQPLSSAGQHKAHLDERHLWPAFYRLIAERQPATVFGEQVTSADGREWLAGVRVDLEELGYAIGATDLCAAGVGAPHIRQRLYWVANAGRPERGETTERRFHESHRTNPGWQEASSRFGLGGAKRDGVANTISKRLEERQSERGDDEPQRPPVERDSRTRVCDTPSHRRSPEGQRPAPRHSNWSDALWIGSEEVGWRRVKPGLCVLADGIPTRLGRLRAFGNAIVPQVGAEFVAAFMECQP